MSLACHWSDLIGATIILCRLRPQPVETKIALDMVMQPLTRQDALSETC